MTAVFSQELLANSTFKWEELAGKGLVIRVGSVPDELGKGMHIYVMGVDKISGKCYVLVNEFKRGETK